MQPIMRIVFAITGLILAAVLANPDNRLFDATLGAIAGYLIADLGVLRTRLEDALRELEWLKKEYRGRSAEPETPTTGRESPQEPRGIEYPEYQRNAAATPAQTPAPVAPLRFEQPWKDIDPPRPAQRLRDAASSEPITPAPSPAIEIAFFGAIRSFFTGGNTLVRVGIIVLFFGVAFLLRYLAEHSHIPVEVKLIGLALGSIALILVGWRLRKTRGGYALALQGGGVGILYLIIFAALRLYSILPASIAFPLLAIIAILSAILDVLQNSMAFAILAVSGGFLAPVLASTGEGSHVVLFSYYAILNLGIVAIAWFKAWRPLNIAGFVYTFAIGTIWGVLKYRPEDFATTEPFLVLFFLFYLGIAILFTLRQPTKTIGYIDGTLIFGTPIVAFSLQSAMLHDRLMALAYSAIVLSALYLAIAYSLKRRQGDSNRLLFESFIALSVAFLTLAIPLALDARWNAVTWALEGTALVWVGCRQSRLLPRLSGALLNIAGACLALTEFNVNNSSLLLPLNDYFGVLLQSAAGVFSACTMQAHRDRLKHSEGPVRDALYWVGLALWMLGSLSELHRYLPDYEMAASMVLVTLTTLGSSLIFGRLALRVAEIAALLLLPSMLGFAVYAGFNRNHPFADGGWWAWLVAFGIQYFLMYRHEGPARGALAKSLNSVVTWLFGILLSWELAWQVKTQFASGDTWATSAWIIVPAFFMWRLPKLVTRIKWPFARNRETYLFVAGVGVAFYLGAWSLFTNVTSVGDTTPLPYLPLINPLDLGQVMVLLALIRYWRFLDAVDSPGTARIDKRVPMPALTVLAFIGLNALLLRTLHQWFGVAFDFDHLMASTLVQTSLSLFWTVLALIAMLLAARKGHRTVWLVGAGLMGVVIAKLFLIDLSRIGSVERIISFVGVGLLMLVVGYFSPLPPARETA